MKRWSFNESYKARIRSSVCIPPFLIGTGGVLRGGVGKVALVVCTSHGEDSDANEGLGDVHGHCDVLWGL